MLIPNVLISSLTYSTWTCWNNKTPLALNSGVCLCVDDLVPSSSSCRSLYASYCQLWPVLELCWLCCGEPSYTPHPEAGDWWEKTQTHRSMYKIYWMTFRWGCCSSKCRSSFASCAEVKHVSVPVAKWRDEIEAAVDSVVLYVPSIQPAFVSEVLFELLVNIVFDRFPAVANT